MTPEELKEAHAKLVEKREAEAAARKEERELVRMRCELELSALAEEQGLVVGETVDGIIVGDKLIACRCPSPKEYIFWLDKTRAQHGPRDKGKSQRERLATEELGRKCLLVPDKIEFAAICDANAGVAYYLGDKAAVMAQKQTQELEGK